MTTDADVQSQIETLETEREQLRAREGESDPTLEQDAGRLEAIRIELDRLWDLKRQRQARRDAGEDPDTATERDAGTVEGYQQ